MKSLRCPCGTSPDLAPYLHDTSTPGCVYGRVPVLPTGPILLPGRVNWDHRFCGHTKTTQARTDCRRTAGV